MSRGISLEHYLGSLDPEQRAQVEAVRALVRTTEPALVEGMKWSAPNWALGGTDRITVNTLNRERRVKLVLHMGVARAEDRSATPLMHDPSGLIAWSSNIRGVVTFTDLGDLEAKAPALQRLLRRWLSIPA